MQSVEKPTSEELLEAVKAFLGDKKQETYEAAIRTLLQVLEDNKSVMVPIHKTSVGSKDAYNVPSTLSASNGKWYYIVYTSEREIPVGRADVMTYMPLRSMFRLVGSTADCGGICLDPWDRGRTVRSLRIHPVSAGRNELTRREPDLFDSFADLCYFKITNWSTKNL